MNLLLKIFTGFSLLTLALGCGTTPEKASPPSSKSPSQITFGIVDSHMHMVFNGKPEETSKIPQTKEELYSEMKEAGIVAGIAHTDSPSNTALQSDGNYHPDETPGISYCAGVDAR